MRHDENTRNVNQVTGGFRQEGQLEETDLDGPSKYMLWGGGAMLGMPETMGSAKC